MPAQWQRDVLLDRYDMTAVEYINYVNNAMMKLFNDKWGEVKGDKQSFVNMFPELVETKAPAFVKEDVSVPRYSYVSLTNTALPLANLYSVLYANYTTTFIENASPDMLFALEMGTVSLASITSPLIVQGRGNLYIFPALSSSLAVTVNYIKLPKKADGNFITQNGDTDSPFDDSWNTVIADIATQMFIAESQNNA